MDMINNTMDMIIQEAINMDENSEMITKVGNLEKSNVNKVFA